MSRILVADDNSNIQKMVALALKDEGIDVVAVGNGEAAMRRIPDLQPDLVLADIFMPVRNGYEVCEFVKSDSRYMSTPVVLLVGAFDPLDEQETQRVRADGVLKKPFVPPDPLINMVKALLAKSNGQKAMPIQTPIEPRAAAPSQPAPQTPAPVSQPSPANEIAAPHPAQLTQQQTVVKAPTPPAAPTVFMAPAQQFPAQTAAGDDSDEVVTASRDPNLGEPFWATPAEPESQAQSESEEETQPADMLDMHSFGKQESSDDEEEEEGERSHFRPDSSLLDKAEFGPDPGAANSQNDGSPQGTNSSPFELADEDENNPAVARTHEEKPSSTPSEPPAEVFKFDPTLTFAPSTQEAPELATEDKTPQNADPAPLELTASDEAAPLPWPAVTESPVEPRGGVEKQRDSHEQIPTLELELPTLPNREAVITAATEAARLAFSELNTLPGSGLSTGRSDREPELKSSLAPSAPNAVPPSPTPEMIDAVVSRLLERMQPEIMEVVNREVLRPAIEAIVRREMKKN